MRVLLIEDQNLLSSTMVTALENAPDIEIVGQSEKASEAMELCMNLRPDIVIMDIFTKEGNGIECTAQIKKAFPDTKVLVITGVEDERMVHAAEEAGADLFAWKSMSLDELTELIRYAKKPYRVFPRVQSESLKSAKFSAVDTQIINLLAQGKTSKEIAEELFLGYGTVRLYISRMYASTGFKSRAQLVAYALRSGLIESD